MEGEQNVAQPSGEQNEVEVQTRTRGRPAQPHCCQVCGQNLDAGGSYHKRYRICPPHMMADEVEVDGCRQRFCQQCGRFHVLAEFEGNKRSCRGQLEKQALRRRLARRAAANQPPGGAEQTGSQSDCCSGSSGAGRGGERAALLQHEVRAEQLFQAVEARAAAAAVASAPPLPWRSGAGLQCRPATAPQSHRHATAEQLVASTQQRQAAVEQLAAAEPQQRAAAEQLAALLLYQQPAAIPTQQWEGHSLPAQQPQLLLQQHGSDHSHHSLIALATAASAGTAAALPSPAAPITPATAEDSVPASQQPASAALPPAPGQLSLSPLLRALLGLAPSLPSPQPQLPPPMLLPSPPQQLPPPPPTLPLVPPLVPPQLLVQLPAQQAGSGPYTQQLISHLVALDQQRLIEQRRAQRSEDDLAALVRAVVQFLTTLSGGSLGPPPR